MGGNQSTMDSRTNGLDQNIRGGMNSAKITRPGIHLNQRCRSEIKLRIDTEEKGRRLRNLGWNAEEHRERLAKEIKLNLFKGQDIHLHQQDQNQEGRRGHPGLEEATNNLELEEALNNLEVAISRIPKNKEAPKQILSKIEDGQGNNGGRTPGAAYGRSIEELFNHSWRAGWGVPNGFGCPNPLCWGEGDSLPEQTRLGERGGERAVSLGFFHRRQSIDLLLALCNQGRCRENTGDHHGGQSRWEERRRDLRKNVVGTTTIRCATEGDGRRKKEEESCSTGREQKEEGEDSKKVAQDITGKKKKLVKGGQWRIADLNK